MAIDDPLEAAEALIASDERQRSPVMGLARNLVEIVKFIPAAQKALEGFTKPAEAIVRWLEHRSQENRDYLVDVLKDELKRVRSQLEEVSEERRQFLERDFIPLTLDGLKKAEDLRTKERIARIAKILAHAAEVGSTKSADYTEEMMRVATILDDTDVEILRQIVVQQGGSLPPSGALDENGANDAWFGSPPSIAGVSDAMLTSICRKLESLGLITSVRPREMRYGLKTVGLPFALLRKGKDFVEYIQGATSTSA